MCAEREKKRSASGIQVIERAARVLRALEGQPQGLSLAEIASKVGLARSTVHRIVTALVLEGFVTPASPNGRVRLGPLLGRLAAAGERGLAFRLRPHLVRLSDKVRETANLTVLEHDGVLLIDQVAGQELLTVFGTIGELLPSHCTSNGKVLLGNLSDEEVRRLLPEQLARYTSRTITDRDVLLAELKEVRKAGISFSLEEYADGVCSVGTLITKGVERAVAISIPVPAQRFYGREEELLAALASAREDIESGA